MAEDIVSPGEIKGLRNDISDLRRDISGLTKELNATTIKRLEQEKDLELRLQNLESSERNRPAQLEQPCQEFLNHKKWHEEQEKAAEIQSRKASDRFWAIVIRLTPYLAMLAAGAAGGSYF